MVIITASYLRMVPRLQMSAGFGFHVKYHDNRRLQIDPTYIPDKAENFEQGLALIYLAIGKNERQLFKETPDWYNSGRESVNLLPWFAARKKEQERYEMLPKVSVEPVWLRVLIKMMKEWKQNISDEKSIRFSFNGEFLTFYCGSRKIPIPAIGEKWINEYQFGFEFIDMLPKRIYQEKDGLLIIDDGYLKIGAAEILIHAVGT
ncbi:MAG: hypothetical protein IPF62_11360 [Bacteroidetes bacterium]|nr:hypothetical protein [Bacteroidota bacterium]